MRVKSAPRGAGAPFHLTTLAMLAYRLQLTPTRPRLGPPHLHGPDEHVRRLRRLEAGQVVQEQREGDGAVGVEGGHGVVGGVGQRLQQRAADLGQRGGRGFEENRSAGYWG